MSVANYLSGCGTVFRWIGRIREVRQSLRHFPFRPRHQAVNPENWPELSHSECEHPTFPFERFSAPFKGPAEKYPDGYVDWCFARNGVLPEDAFGELLRAQ